MGAEPDDTYSGSVKKGMFDVKNIEAAFGMSDNTEHMLYNGYVYVSASGGAGLNTGGILSLPIEEGKFTITSWVGYRPPSDTNGIGSTNHSGIDFAAPEGTPIYASLGGTVTKADWYGGYGKAVVIVSGDTEIIYGHMSEINAIRGQTVQAGQQIGAVGSTGNSTGAHLHFEVHQNGKVIDPAPLLGLK